MKINSLIKRIARRLCNRFGYQLVDFEYIHKSVETKNKLKENQKFVELLQNQIKELKKIEKNTREFRLKVQKNSLMHYYSNIYSQRGDDGIIREIFRRLNINKGFFVEFGAWDGIYLSNCRLLFENGWEGLFIESDKDKFSDLKNEYSSYSDIICLNETVSPDGKNGKKLDEILESNNIKKEISFLSIDVDGLDLNIFESLKIKPLVVCIEGGFSWHPSITKRVPDKIAARNMQQPLSVAIKSAIDKGYFPICFNQNLYVVREDYFEPFKDIDISPERLYLDAFYFYTEDFRRHVANFRKKDKTILEFELGNKEIIPGY